MRWSEENARGARGAISILVCACMDGKRRANVSKSRRTRRQTIKFLIMLSSSGLSGAGSGATFRTARKVGNLFANKIWVLFAREKVVNFVAEVKFITARVVVSPAPLGGTLYRFLLLLDARGCLYLPFACASSWRIYAERKGELFPFLFTSTGAASTSVDTDCRASQFIQFHGGRWRAEDDELSFGSKAY